MVQCGKNWEVDKGRFVWQRTNKKTKTETDDYTLFELDF
jgi:hypothetical protein